MIAETFRSLVRLFLIEPRLASATRGCHLRCREGSWPPDLDHAVWLFRGEAALAGGISGSCRRVFASRRVDRTIRRQRSFMRQRSYRNPETLHGKDENPPGHDNPPPGAEQPSRSTAPPSWLTRKSHTRVTTTALSRQRCRNEGPGAPSARRVASRRELAGAFECELPVTNLAGPARQGRCRRGLPPCQTPGPRPDLAPAPAATRC